MFCPNCGTQVEDDCKFCPDCGSPIAGSAPVQPAAPVPPVQPVQPTVPVAPVQPTPDNTQQTYTQQNVGQQYANIPRGGGTNRNIVLCIVFSLITCGIYSIYWMIKLNDEINMLDGTPEDTSGGVVFLLTLVTCGIYGFFWMYKMGGKVDNIKTNIGITPSSFPSNVLFLLLNFLCLGIVNYCLMQDTINKASV